MERLGRYEILAELGHGAMGTVYRARDPKIDRVVALKTIAVAGVTAGDEEAYRQRFFREAQAAGKLSHGGIVTIYDVGEEESSQTPFIVMEFIEGQTLEELARGERLPLPTALELAKQMAEALDYAHGHKIVHRDIKPANIIITPDGRAKITDFGIAKLQTTQFTQPGQVLGTPAYMSPEQLSGAAVDGRSDIFSLGVILYWLVTGDKPFAGDTTTAVTFKIVYQDPIPPTQLNPALSPDFDFVIGRALAKDPARRYQHGRELAADMDDLKNARTPRSRAGQGTPEEVERTVVKAPGAAAPAPPPTATVKTTPLPRSPLAQRAVAAPTAGVILAPADKKRRWIIAAGALAVLLLVFGVVGWWWSSRSAQQAEPEPGAAKEADVSTPTAPARSPGRRTREAEPRTRAVATATLRLTGEHNFDRGTLYVYADEQLLREIRISGETVERSGAKVGFGRISASLPVPAGTHTISVRINAPRDDFDQIKNIRGEFEAGQTRTLEISLGKLGKWVGIGSLTRDLTLHWVD